MPRAARSLARRLLNDRMTFGLVLGTALIVIVAYAFWMAGELGVAPRWRRSRAPRDVAQDIGAEHGSPRKA
jgi:hypothetical protein